MAILDRVIEVGPDSARCSCRVGEDNPFFVPGVGVPCWVGIEFMAQCIAVSAGVRAVLSGEPLPVGLLLGTMAFNCSVDSYGPKGQYEATCSSLIRDAQGLGAFDCTIAHNGETIATARLTVKELEGEAAAHD
jgi:predicted hotdog family 3-hydroxylacyl-ACP dehydratase